MTKNRRPARGILNNKKGFTFVEAIVVVAIMGVLAVVIGSLVGSATTAYMRQKENAAAKDLSTIVAKEMSRKLTSAQTVFLEIENDGELPEGSFRDEINNVSYTMTNVPFGASNNKRQTFYSADGILYYQNTKAIPTISYFSDGDAEKRAFYGSFKIKVHYTALLDGTGKYSSLKIYVDVYKNEIADANLKYDSPGIVVNFRESLVSDTGIIHSFADLPTNINALEVTDTTVKGTYKELINTTTEYTHLYYV